MILIGLKRRKNAYLVNADVVMLVVVLKSPTIRKVARTKICIRGSPKGHIGCHVFISTDYNFHLLRRPLTYSAAFNSRPMIDGLSRAISAP